MNRSTNILRTMKTLHEKGEVCNICVDYSKLMDCGFQKKCDELDALATEFSAKGLHDKAAYSLMQKKILTAIMTLADKYRALALKMGRIDVAETLTQVPSHRPESFLQALQMLRIIHFTMWLSGSYHNTLGRFDQYMLPYFRQDIAQNALTHADALELVEEFFLACNRDTDLYPGMQQGDNGQSLALGGCDHAGQDAYNELSDICLRASLELQLIDPKINLRVDSRTPLERYMLGSQLTKQGLGFPQYCNDDVVIPALINFGYAPEDAKNYVVAACWEFIIPGKGMDIPNINAISFAEAMQRAVNDHLLDCDDFASLMEYVKTNIYAQANACVTASEHVYLFPAPFLSLMMDGCSETAQDVSLGCKYNNYGFHGTGLSTAADALCAIRLGVYEESVIDKERLLAALKTDFAQDKLLQAQLRYDMPKMGNNDDRADSIAAELLHFFADSLAGQRNDRGGIFRPGTGSAMYYVSHAANLPATADGRNQGENLAANYSPSLFARLNGPTSILRSFAKPDLKSVCNGGPLTMELHDSLFRNDQAIEKVALMVQSFIRLGGHQLQLNAVNRDELLDAKKHPEAHRSLIVRVWGWSGYFVELDEQYQDHIISRTELML